MSLRHFSIILLLIAGFAGCAHKLDSGKPSAWPQTLSENESSRSKQAGISAAESPELLERFKPKRMTSEPLKLDTAHAEVYVIPPDYSRITIAIPSGGRVGWHPTYLAVEVSRGSYEVLRMYESFWP